MDFGIQIEDGSMILSSFAAENNSNSVRLHKWQSDAIEYFFNHNCKSIFEVCTGAGKTFCTIQIIKEIWKKDSDCNILIVVPKNIILETGWYKELYEAGISLKDIGVYYGAIKEMAKITITNMQSIKKVAVELFDCIIFDEVHNFGTKRLLPFVEREVKYKIGLSATLERMDQTHWKIMKYFDYNIFKYIPRDALQDGVLNSFKFTNIGINMDSDSMDKYNKLTSELNMILQKGGGFGSIMRGQSGLKFKMLKIMNDRKQLVNNYPIKFDAIKQICLKHKDDKIIIFNQFNMQTNKCYWTLLDVGIKAGIMHSGISKQIRDQTIIDFKNNKINCLLTSKVLDEGTNLPKLDVAIIAAGDSTTKQTVQRMGRVLRKKETQSYLYQVYCKYTIEETYGNERANMFKELCTEYKEYDYSEE